MRAPSAHQSPDLCFCLAPQIDYSATRCIIAPATPLLSFAYVFLLIFMRNMLASIIDACINERLTFCARILIKLPRVHKVRHSSLIVFSLALDWYLFIVGKGEPWPFISKHKTMYIILWSISGLTTFSLRVFYIFT